MNKASLAKKIRQKLGQAIEPDQEQIDPDAPMRVPNRKDKRRSKQASSSSGSGSVHEALQLGPNAGRKKRATGQPNWFRQMKYDDMRRKALEKVDLDQLEPAVGPVAVSLYRGGYRNVWQLTQVTDVNDLLKVGQHDNPETGLRARDLAKLRTYLVQQRVPVKWEI